MLMYLGLILNFIYASDFGGIKGFVRDASNGEKLSYADVYIAETGLGTCTDDKGYYYLPKIPPGDYQIIFSYIGYETISQGITIKPGAVISLNVELKPIAIEVEGVTTTAERERFEKAVEVSRITLTTREIGSVPAFFEADLIKSLQLIPGIVTMHDLSNKLYVRGGSPDENLVLLDGIIVYNPSTHLLGLFSTFNPDAIAEAELYAGGFPAKYGDRLSAVLDVETKEGNSKEYSGETSIGLISSKLLVEGPIPKGSILFSGRRTYFDGLAWAYANIFNKDISLPYYFYDGVGKINFNPSTENRWTLTGFGGSDVLSLEVVTEAEPASEKIDVLWGNRGASLRWRRVFAPKLYGEILGVWSNFFTEFRYIDFSDTTRNLELFNEIRSWTSKVDFTYLLNQHHTIDFGFHAENLRVDEKWMVEAGHFGKPSQRSNLMALYLQDKWSLVQPVVFLQPGLRTIYYEPAEEKGPNSFSFKRKSGKIYFDPRLGLKYRYGPNSAFNLGLGKYSQFLVTINNQESYFSIFDFWRPVGKMHEPPYSLHIVSGIEQWYGEQTKFTVEGYYKRYYNLLIPRQTHLFFSEPTESLEVGRGYALGIDLFLKKSLKNYFGWLSYSLGFTRRQVDEDKYFPRYDRRHNLNILFGFNLPEMIPVFKKGRLDLRWYLGTGLPYAGDIARYAYYYEQYADTPYWARGWRFIKGPRDAFRLPLCHRLDLHFEKGMRLFGLKGSWHFDIINLYAQKNILFYEWQYYDERTGEELNPPKQQGYAILPIPIPSFGLKLRF